MIMNISYKFPAQINIKSLRNKFEPIFSLIGVNASVLIAYQIKLTLFSQQFGIPGYSRLYRYQYNRYEKNLVYLFKVSSNRNHRKSCETYSKRTTKTP